METSIEIRHLNGKAVVRLPKDACLTSKPLGTQEWEVSLQDSSGDLLRAPWRKDRPLSERHARRDPQIRKALAELDGVKNEEEAEELLKKKYSPGSLRRKRKPSKPWKRTKKRTERKKRMMPKPA